MKDNLLQDYVERELEKEIDISFLNIDLESFNVDKNIILFDYQKEAIENTVRLLLKYFNDGGNDLKKYYIDNLTEEEMSSLSINKDMDGFDILMNHFQVIEDKISFTEFINRACYWMATASGKTLIIVKLIEILYELMKRNEIPQKKVMIIAPDEKLINQIKEHIDIFSSCSSRSNKIYLKELKQYEKMQHSGTELLTPNSITVYYTMGHHISDKNKEKLFDYRDYLEDNGWYLILDEAHKGTFEESRRKQSLAALTKNGFMFNFSATFTDDIDRVTTIYNFNLQTFIKAGYGKNIKILDDEFKNFKVNNRREADFDNEEKTDIVLKSFIIYTGVKKAYEKFKGYNLEFDLGLKYHNPLMVTISNEINTRNADMKLYFKCLVDLAKRVDSEKLEKFKSDIIADILEEPRYSIGDEILVDDFTEIIKSITYKDILNQVFNSEEPGQIEVYEIGNNNDELSFKLKSSTNEYPPFALIKASNVKNWKRNVLKGYNFNEDVVSGEKGRFSTIHQDFNEINLLMGSRQFIEGWNSNRPNVINFINMGTNDENTKLILQAIGRGVRIEPIINNRKRFEEIKGSLDCSYKIKENVSKIVNPLETLFIFATNKGVIKNILDEIGEERWESVKGVKKTEIKKILYVPVYKKTNENMKPYRIAASDYENIISKISSTSIKLLLVRDNIELKTLNRIMKKDRILVDANIRSREMEPLKLINTIETHLRQKGEELVGFEERESITIEHYKHIQVNVNKVAKKEIFHLEEAIKGILESKESAYTEKQKEVIKLIHSVGKGEALNNTIIREQADRHQINIEDILNKPDYNTIYKDYNIKLKNISRHYYNPIILSEDNDNYKYIIKNKSEIEFLEDLEEYIQNNEIDYDWWYFSRIDENKDKIYIPYYDQGIQRYRKFYPDFIFWMKKGQKYYIKFVDPKGLLMEENPRYKIDGYEETLSKLNMTIDGLSVETSLLYYSGQIKIDEKINKYKFFKDSFGKLF